MTDPSDRWREVRRKIDRLEERLRRGRLTVPTYLTAGVFFLLSGLWTGSWAPAGVLAGLCLAAAWLTHRHRRARVLQLRALEALERSLPGEGPSDGPDGRASDAGHWGGGGEGPGTEDEIDRGSE